MDEIVVRIEKTKIIIFERGEEWIINESKFPELRKKHSEGLYDAFIDRDVCPPRIRFMRKYLDLTLTKVD